MAKDKYHDAVKTALIKDGWTITHDPYPLEFNDLNTLQVDLGAEKMLAAQRHNQKIAVEIKSFSSVSMIKDFYLALGQYQAYKTALRQREPERTLYLALPWDAYNNFFKRSLPMAIIAEVELKLCIYDPSEEVITSWEK
ncbi:MAG: element excision factor XisH family protein [Deinococcales bacterium]